MKPVLLIISLMVSGVCSASDPLHEDKPFAEAHVVLQVSRADPSRYSLSLDIANNLNKHYGGQDMVDIQVIAFGPGVAMLFAADNENLQRIESLMAHGVRFYVCGNTMDTIERHTGARPMVVNGVETVQTGVAFMIEQVNKGYTHVHP